MVDCVKCGEQFATTRMGSGMDGRPVDQDLCIDCRKGPEIPTPEWLKRMNART
jgi:hypothetical protein